MSAPFQVMPPLTDAEYADLRASIEAEGVLTPVVVDQHGRTIDGHHRQEIAAALGIDCPTTVRRVENAREARGLAYTLNLKRRHLTREQRRELLAESIRNDPDLSDRQHAERVGTSKNTAAAVRGVLESTGQVDQLTERTGADGKARPAHVTTTTRTTEATKVERDVDLDTGEILDGGLAGKAGRAAADDAVIDLPGLGPSLMTRFLGSIGRAWDITHYSPERIAEAATPDEFTSLLHLADSIAKFTERAVAARGTGLRAVKG